MIGPAEFAAAAQARCDAWDDMHRAYFPDYDERWRLAVDVMRRWTADRLAPRVLDLGCGPGTLTRRLAQALPSAQIVGVDRDPLLIDLARALARGERLSYRRLAVGGEAATAVLRSLAPFDAIVSSAFVHYFDREGLMRLQLLCREILAPGGLLVTVEQFAGDGQTRAKDGGGAWGRWWSETRVHPSLGQRVEPDANVFGAAPPPLTQEVYAEVLAEAGFAEARWMRASGGSAVVAARRDAAEAPL